MNTPTLNMIIDATDAAFHASIESGEPLCLHCAAASVIAELPEEVVRTALTESVADFVEFLHSEEAEVDA